MNKRVLYEQIMSDVAKVVKKHLNENETYDIDWSRYIDSNEYKKDKESFKNAIDPNYLDRNIQYCPSIKKNGSLFFIDLKIDCYTQDDYIDSIYIRITGKNLLELCVKIYTLIYGSINATKFHYEIVMDKKLQKVYKNVIGALEYIFIDDDYIDGFENKIGKIIDNSDELNNKKYELVRVLDSINFKKAILKTPRYS